MKPVLVFDIETDGLNPTKIHCMSWCDLSQYDEKICHTSDYHEMIRVISDKNMTLVGHNIQRYDLPALEKLLGIAHRTDVIDTLAMSWYLFPKRLKHSLEEWGNFFGEKKVEIDDWENLTVEDYFNRCDVDVSINIKLFKLQFKKLVKLYKDRENLDRFLEYISFKMDCAAEQERFGWKLDVPRVKELLLKLTAQKEDKLSALVAGMPQIPNSKVFKRPIKMFKKNGQLSIAGTTWVTEVPKEHQNDPEYTKIISYSQGNPNSHIQIKDWLFSLGWRPSTFVYKRDKVTGEVKKIPQVQQDKSLGPGLCESVKRLIPKAKVLSELDSLSIITHRISILEGFIENVDERGYIKAEIQGFTNTLRFKHRVIVNLPSVDKLWGSDIRGCLIAPDGYELAGSDMSSLEDRTKQHYMFPYDPSYVLDMSKDDFDPHLDLALSNKAVTEEEVAKYKLGKCPNIQGIRHNYKQGNYACTYGARPQRISLTLGIPLGEAKDIFDAYWARNWSLEKISEDQTIEIVDGEYWLYNPVSHFYYSLRNTKDVFSTLNQGTGVYCFDTYLKHIKENGPPIIGQFHDEWIGLIRKGKRIKMKLQVEKAIRQTNEELGLNRKLDAEVQFGNNYSEIH